MRLLACFLALGFVGAAVASAQTAPGSCSVATATMTVNRVVHPLGVGGDASRTPSFAPYSLVRVNTQLQTLSNGVQITTRQETREWRDAEGRTRVETWAEHSGQMELQSVSINDPVLRENIVLHPKVQVAQMTRYPQPTPTPYQPRPVDKAFQEAIKAEYQGQPASQIENKNEPLEPTVIAGECAQGVRWTQIIPAGAMGNDAEIRTVSENWFSPRLGIPLRFVTDDPRSGHMVSEVTELHLEAPDPSLFQPPPEYQVFDLTRNPAQP
jgi:hypothetical protein